MIIDRRYWLFSSLFLWAVSTSALESIGCPTLRHGYGPYDYRTITKQQIVLVEGAHFFPNVENLRDGTPHPNRGYPIVPGGEIDYTLRAFPNHHRALMALSRLSIRDKSDRPKGAKASVDCYFKSAMDFRPDDSYVFLIYGIHLSKKGRTCGAHSNTSTRPRLLVTIVPMLHYNLDWHISRRNGTTTHLRPRTRPTQPVFL